MKKIVFFTVIFICILENVEINTTIVGDRLNILGPIYNTQILQITQNNVLVTKNLIVAYLCLCLKY